MSTQEPQQVYAKHAGRKTAQADLELMESKLRVWNKHVEREAALNKDDTVDAKVKRLNARDMVVRHRPAKVRENLTFCSLGPWGF